MGMLERSVVKTQKHTCCVLGVFERAARSEFMSSGASRYIHARANIYIYIYIYIYIDGRVNIIIYTRHDISIGAPVNHY